MPIDRLARANVLTGADLVPVSSATAQDDQAATLATLTAYLRANMYNTTAPVAVSGSKASGAALVSLLLALSQLGLITDNTTT